MDRGCPRSLGFCSVCHRVGTHGQSNEDGRPDGKRLRSPRCHAPRGIHNSSPLSTWTLLVSLSHRDEPTPRRRSSFVLCGGEEVPTRGRFMYPCSRRRRSVEASRFFWHRHSTHVRWSLRKKCQSGPVGMSGRVMTASKKKPVPQSIMRCHGGCHCHTVNLTEADEQPKKGKNSMTQRNIEEPRDCSFWSRVCEFGEELFRNATCFCVCITSLRSSLPRIRKDDPGYLRLSA